MARTSLLFLSTLALLILFGTAAASPACVDFFSFYQDDGPAVEATPENVLGLLYRGEAATARKLVDRLIEKQPGDPLALLIKARVLRETLFEMDDDKSLIRRDAQPIHELLDRVLELCSAEDSLKNDPKRRLYQGWAWMFKAQLHALGASYWSAGRASARGNKLLKEYLEEYPDDPDAQGILGTFLYFADTLPATIKIAKKILLIPGGDRRKGLAYLQYAASHESLLRTDHRIIRTSIFLIFEGRFEEGIQEYLDLLDRYPDYLRLVELLGILSSFNPVNYQALRDLEAATVAAHILHRPENIDENTLLRLRYHRAYADKFFEPAQAVREFSALIDEQPARPDWLLPQSLLNLGDMEANSGNPEAADELFKRVQDDPRMGYFHNLASKLLEQSPTAVNLYQGDISGMVDSIYTTDTAGANEKLNDYQQRIGRNIIFYFYSGESRLLRGDLQGATEYYRKTLEAELPIPAQCYQMIAAARLAEIDGAGGQYRSAEEYLDRALHYYQMEFLADTLIEARKRYYHRLAEGELEGHPTLLEPLTTVQQAPPTFSHH